MVSAWIHRTSLGKYAQKIRTSPREVIWNKHLITTTLVFGLSAFPMTWDQGMGGSVPSLKGFQEHFHLTAGSNAKEIQTFVSYPYLGYIIGCVLSFFVNDRIGRKWMYRVSTVIYVTGQLMAIFSPTTKLLYPSRIITGIGIGGFTVTGPTTLSEIAPAEIRGLVTSWYVVCMQIALFSATFSVYGVYLHMAASKLQFQIIFTVPIIIMALMVVCTFFVCDSPRWLMIVGRREEALENLSKLRGLPASHIRVQEEFRAVSDSLAGERLKFVYTVKEMFTKKTNLRRVQQTLIAYALAQLSGANSLTSYFIPIVTLINPHGGTKEHIFLSGMYNFSKLWWSLIASFLLIDALGRRKSLFTGAFIQTLTHIYLAIYLKISQTHKVSNSYSESTIAALFIHAFGYTIGLLTLPYVFGSELWPNHLRAFGSAFSGAFHWAFIYAIKYALPSILKSMDNWGAFLFFAAWCLIAIIYTYFVIPEVAGLGVEEIEEVFKGSWFKAYKLTRFIESAFDVEKVEGIADTKHEEQ